MSRITLRYIKIDLFASRDGYLPPHFLGSTLRGAFGAALKDVVCVNPKFECEGCFAADNCLYHEFFEAKNRFHNFRFDFKLYPKDLQFGLYLFNEATQKYPYVLSALHRMIERKGLGARREKLKIGSMKINGETIYDGEFKSLQIEPKNFENDDFRPVAKVKLITPLRMKRGGRFLKPDNLDIKDILISIIKKRAHFDGEEIVLDSFPKVVMKKLEFRDFTRYSNRQRTKMKVGGIVGEMIVSDLSPQSYELLKYGEVSGVGKLNTFGLGKIEVEDI